MSRGVELSQNYGRLFHRWEIVRGWVPAVIFALVSLGLELFFLNYLVGLGFVNLQILIPFGPVTVPVSMALMLSLGVVVVLVSLWVSVFENLAYVRTGPDREVRRLLYPLRMVRVAALVLTPFTLLLFIPYILQSGWFVGFASSTAVLQGGAGDIYNWGTGLRGLDFSTRFIVSQLVATLGAILVSGLQLWRVRGTRNLIRLLRKKR